MVSGEAESVGIKLFTDAVGPDKACYAGGNFWVPSLIYSAPILQVPFFVFEEKKVMCLCDE